MNATQPSRPSLRPAQPVRTPRRRYQRHPYRAVAAEVTAKLAVNVLLVTAASIALAKLIPQYFSQQEKLQEIRSEVQSTETRVSQLRTDFNRYFDPQQEASIMREQTNRVDPTQLQIRWKNRTQQAEEAAQP